MPPLGVSESLDAIAKRYGADLIPGFQFGHLWEGGRERDAGDAKRGVAKSPARLCLRLYLPFHLVLEVVPGSVLFVSSGKFHGCGGAGLNARARSPERGEQE